MQKKGLYPGTWFLKSPGDPYVFTMRENLPFVLSALLLQTANPFHFSRAQLRRPSRRAEVRCSLDMEAPTVAAVRPAQQLERDIFCNRELNMKQIEAIGFDMDYTLAQYNEAFDMLAFEGAKDKLIDMGYPSEARSRRPVV